MESAQPSQKGEQHGQQNASKKRKHSQLYQTPASISSLQIAANKYRTAKAIKIKGIKDKKLKGTLKKAEKRIDLASKRAAQAEMLLTEDAGYLEGEGMERTWKFRQSELKEHVDINTSRKMFNLDLPDLGPYKLDYTRNGRFILIGGRKGHIASFNWSRGKIACELQVQETIKDVKWMHNETMFAVAQKKYTYLYDKTGTELHCLRKQQDVNRIEFLPYHFLMVTIANTGILRYQDTSTGSLVAELKTRLGRCDTMAQNPYNAIINLGHANGTVTMWSPTMSTPLVTMLCHKGPVQALAIDRGGYYMATSGLDGQLKIWDVRTYKPMQEYFTPTPASSLTISQKGILAVGYGPHLSLWKDAFKTKQKEPYMSHLFAGHTLEDMAFCPFEDVLGCGHSGGISSLVIPGSGEPNFDTFEANPYQTRKQRQESEVHSLLDKVQPEMITLNPMIIGQVDPSHAAHIAEERRKEWEANNPKEKFVPANKARGKSTSMRRFVRKQVNIVDSKREELRERLEKRAQEEKAQRIKAQEAASGKPKSALDRFQ